MVSKENTIVTCEMSQTTKHFEDSGESIVYGLTFFSKSTTNKILSFSDVSSSKELVWGLAEKINSSEVYLVHVQDILEDALV